MNGTETTSASVLGIQMHWIQNFLINWFNSMSKYRVGICGEEGNSNVIKEKRARLAVYSRILCNFHNSSIHKNYRGGRGGRTIIWQE